MLFANNCNTTLNGGITAIATSMIVTSATGFPVPTGSQYFYCTLADAATQTTIEIVKVTAVSGTTFTIVRGQDGTTGTIFASGAVVSLRLVRASLNDFPKLDEANTFTGLLTANSFASSSATITGGTLNGVAIGGTTAGDGTFDVLTANVTNLTNVTSSAGIAITGTFTGSSPTDGLVMDYATGWGRFSDFGGDGFQWFNGGLANTKLMQLSSTGVITTATWNGATIGVAYGGTGLTSLTANYIPYGNGTGAFSSTSAFTYTSTGLGVGTSATSIIDGRVDQAAITYITVQNRYHNSTLTQKAGLKLQLGDISESFKWCSVEAVPTSAYESGAGLSFNTYNGTTPAQGMFINNIGGVQTLNTISVGNATPSSSGAGVTFPATQSASTNVNTLDDYEEGTWTPTGNGVTFTAGTTGWYTKVGNLVTLNFIVNWPVTANGSPAYVTNLPFTTNTNAGVALGGYTTDLNMITLVGNTILYPTNLAATVVTVNATLSGKSIVGCVSYMT